jgi:DNA polymerase III epsilon subunit-like protein
MNLFAVFDTETTGIPKHPNAKDEVQPRIIEFGAALVDYTGKVYKEFECLFNPGVKLEPIITKITGLTDEDLADQPTYEQQAAKIRTFFGMAEAVIAHNLPFDSTILDLEEKRLGNESFPFPYIKLCTVQENAERWGRRPKLTEMYEEVTGEKLAQSHRALDDVHALVEVCIKTGLLHEIHTAIESQN